jgi:large subunit ribosomal protein L10
LAISKERKEELVASYAELLSASNGFALVNATGLSVAQVQNLRRKVLGAGGRYVVTKNTLLRIALEQNDWSVPSDLLNGPTAIVFGGESFPTVAKVVLDFVESEKLEEKIQVKGGVMTGTIIDASGVVAVSNLPSLDELRAQLIGMVVAPAQGLVNVLHSATGQVVNVLHAYIEDRGGDQSDAA